MSMTMSKAGEYLEQAREKRHHYPPWFRTKEVDEFLALCVSEIAEGGVDADVVFSPCGIVTMMRGENFREFVTTGKYLTFWQTGATWHTRYSADPKAARIYNDLRLFGQRAEDTAFALVMNGDGFQIPYDTNQNLRKYLTAYGDSGKLVQWKREVLEDATFTYGDCQQNIIAFEFSPENLMGYSLAFRYMLFRAMRRRLKGYDRLDDFFMFHSNDEVYQSCGAAFLSAGQVVNPYFEIQIHRPLTPEDMLGVIA